MATAPKVPGSQAAKPLPIVPTTVENEALPNAVDVDMAKLTEPLLTRQGWLVPAPKPVLRG